MTRRRLIPFLAVIAVAAAVETQVASGSTHTSRHHAHAALRGSGVSRPTEVASTCAPALPAGSCTGSSLSPTQIDTVALSIAGQNADPAPTSMVTVATTRGMVYPMIFENDSVGADPTPVYATTMQGNFTADNALVPSGAPLPTGTVLSLIMDAQTGQLLDERLSNQSVDISSAGKVVFERGKPAGTLARTTRRQAHRRHRKSDRRGRSRSGSKT